MAEAQIEIPGDEAHLEAFVACPDGPGPSPPVLLLGAPAGFPLQVQRLARRLSAQGYYVLAPDWCARRALDRREDAEAWFDHLAADRRTDDARVAVLGFGEGADLALRLAAWRAERIAAVAAFGGQGLGAAAAADVAQRLNAVIRVGYPIGRPSARIGVLETALALAGADFEVEIYEDQPDWAGLLDLLARTLRPPPAPAIAARIAPGSTDGRPI
ncbi:MAG: dienelactone hydrolase family protein [Caulobacterales bacterium]|nr:dienelactone hydrolase family protein [Caulobacterales bacterium]